MKKNTLHKVAACVALFELFAQYPETSKAQAGDRVGQDGEKWDSLINSLE